MEQTLDTTPSVVAVNPPSTDERKEKLWKHFQIWFWLTVVTVLFTTGFYIFGNNEESVAFVRFLLLVSSLVLQFGTVIFGWRSIAASTGNPWSGWPSLTLLVNVPILNFVLVYFWVHRARFKGRVF